MCREGGFVTRDFGEALKWYCLSAEQGLADAQCNLGLMHGEGQGVKQNFKEAIKWYHFSAEQGYALAESNLGLMYEEGKGIKQNQEEAIKCYRLAAKQGLAGAQSKLGFMYESGNGVMYALGRGVSKDCIFAHMWWNICSYKGDKDCVKNKLIKKINVSSPNRKRTGNGSQLKPTNK